MKVDCLGAALLFFWGCVICSAALFVGRGGTRGSVGRRVLCLSVCGMVLGFLFVVLLFRFFSVLLSVCSFLGAFAFSFGCCVVVGVFTLV